MAEYNHPFNINPILNKKFEDLGDGSKTKGFVKWSKGANALDDMKKLRVHPATLAILRELKKSHPNDEFRIQDIRMWLRANADDFIAALGGEVFDVDNLLAQQEAKYAAEN